MINAVYHLPLIECGKISSILFLRILYTGVKWVIDLCLCRGVFAMSRQLDSSGLLKEFNAEIISTYLDFLAEENQNLP